MGPNQHQCLAPGNACEAREGDMRQRLAQLDLGPITLVRVPSSKSVRFEQDDTPLRMARAVQSLMGNQCVVESWLFALVADKLRLAF